MILSYLVSIINTKILILNLFLLCFCLTAQGQTNRALEINKKLKEANSLVRLHKYNQAIGLLEKTSKEAPNDLSVINSLIRLYLDTEKYDEAIFLLNHHLQRLPNNISLHRKLADAFYLTGQFEKADETIQTLIIRSPQNESVVHQIGSLYTKWKWYEKAAQFYLAARQKIAKPDAFSIQLAGLYTKILDITRATEEYVRWLVLNPSRFNLVSDRLDQLVEFSTQSLVEQSLINSVSEYQNSQVVYDLFGDFYLRNKRPAKALTQYHRANQLDNSSGKYLIQFAKRAKQEGYLEEAIQVYLDLIQTRVNNSIKPEIMIRLAEIYQEKGNNSKALASYQDILDHYPESRYHDTAKINLAGLYLNTLHNPLKALDLYQSLLTKSTDSELKENAILGAAKGLITIGRLDGANKYFNQILNSKSTNSENKVLAKLHLGEIALYQGRIDDALNHFYELADQKTASVYANDALEWILLLDEIKLSKEDSFEEYISSVLLQSQFRDNEALDACKRYIQDYPGSVIRDTVLRNIGLILLRLGKPYQAVAAFRNLIQSHPKSSHLFRVHWQIAETFETKIGDISQAMKTYETILISFPDHFNNGSVRRKIKQLSKNYD
tara:strand:- start:35278 stop:37104 length:1827 start_codon:yes stop_codon:yes gene_type:complete